MNPVKEKANIWLAVGLVLLTLLIFSLSWYSYTYNKTFDQLTLFTPSGEWTENNLAFVETGLKVKSDAPLEEKLEKLAQTLSEAYDGLPIVFLGVEISFGDQIAVFDLREKHELAQKTTANREQNISDESELISWQYLLESNSYEVNQVANSITKSLLQSNYEADWIDGVRILYEGERMPFYSAYSLYSTVYRTQIKDLSILNIGDPLGTLKLSSKAFDEERNAIYYTLESEFTAYVNLVNGSDFDKVWIKFLESSIMKYNLELKYSWEDPADVYIENSVLIFQ